MIARAQQTLFGQDLSSISPDLVFLIAIILTLVGLALAFAGRRVWKHTMSFVGALIGGMFGFLFGAAIGGWLIGFVGGMVGGFIGSALFVFLARLGIAVVAGALTMVIVGAVTGSGLGALVLGGIAFVVTFIFVETAIGLVTAIVGALLFGAGLFLLDLTDMLLVVIGILGVAVFGAAFQMIALKEEKEMRLAHHAMHHPVAAASVAAPTPPPMPGRTCSRCGGELTYIPEYERYYCHRCQRYE